MPNLTISTDVDSMLSAANNAAIRSAIGLGSALTVGASDAAVSSAGTFAVRRTAGGLMQVSENGGAYETISKLDKRNVTTWGADPTGVADSTAAIQAAIDYAIYTSKRGPVFLDGQKFKTSDTIHLGYGETFHSVGLVGFGYDYRNFSNVFVGTSLIPTFSDRPCINIQGARGTYVRGITCYGKLFPYIQDTLLGVPTQTSIDDTDRLNWNDPAFPLAVDNRYAPYAGITVDAYCGVRPVTSYPDVVYPVGYVGAQSQYGKAFSSGVLIEDVHICGFNTGFVNQPCDADGNGDFTNLRRVIVSHCKFGVSVGNSQSRNLAMSQMTMESVHTCVTNNQHGRRIGKFSGVIQDLSVQSVIQIFDFLNTTHAGPLEFTNFYGESMWRIGDCPPATTVENSIRFSQSQFAFNSQTDFRGVPATILRMFGSNSVDVAFIGCDFSYFKGAASFEGIPLFDGCRFRDQDFGSARPSYAYAAYNFLCGGLAMKNWDPGDLPHRLQFQPNNIDTGAAHTSSLRTGESYKFGQRRFGIPLYVRTTQPNGDRHRGASLVPQGKGWPIDKAVLSSCTLVNRVLTLTFTALADFTANIAGLLPGDVLYDEVTGTVFFIRSRTTTTVIAEQQNNYKANGVNWQTLTSVGLTTGYFYAGNSRFFTLDYSLLGTLTAASPTITAAGRDDGYSGFLASGLTVGDAIFTDTDKNRVFPENFNLVTARDDAARTITINGNAPYSITRHPLPFWIRVPVANSATR